MSGREVYRSIVRKYFLFKRSEADADMLSIVHWDPDRTEWQWFSQVAALHTSYYHAQIITHNPFPFIQRAQPTVPYATPWEASRRPILESMPAPLPAASTSEYIADSGTLSSMEHSSFTAKTNLSSTSTQTDPPWTLNQASSFAICTNAAHACSRIFAEQLRRDAQIFPVQIGSAFHSALVLLVNIWGARKDRGSASEEYTKVILDDLRACVAAVKRLEPGWARAGRMWYVINFNMKSLWLMQSCLQEVPQASCYAT